MFSMRRLGERRTRLDRRADGASEGGLLGGSL